jgi:elongation factor 2
MRKFEAEQVIALMKNPSNVRNLSVIAHVDHGKSTLTDSLICMAGIIKAEDAGKRRGTDTMQEEQDRAITIKSTGVSLYFTTPDYLELPADSNGNEYLANLIDSPGHVDFSSEVTAALRVTDGGLVVVDCVEGVAVQTETVLRQALAESVKPTLVVNKMDRMFLELEMDAEEQYVRYVHIIENVNVTVSVYQNDELGDWRVDPAKGTVAFASGYYGWGFTLDTFARYYAGKVGMEWQKLRRRLWGDWFFDESSNKFTRVRERADGTANPRGFCQFVLEPIQRLTVAALAADEKPLRFDNMLERLGVRLSQVERREERGRDLLRLVMQRWLPAGPALRDMIIAHLPSPVEAQRYRAALLYSGPCRDEDPTYKAIRECDPNGPLVFYVSKMVSLLGQGKTARLYAFGRVFSGTIRTGHSVLVDRRDADVGGACKKSKKYQQRSNGAASSSSSSSSSAVVVVASDATVVEVRDEADVAQAGSSDAAAAVIVSSRPASEFVRGKVQRVSVAMCARFEPCMEIPAGSTAALLGVEKFLKTTGTLLSADHSFPLHPMRFSVSPVVRVSVRVAKTSHLPHLVAALRRLSSVETLVQVNLSESGEHTICAVGELHCEIVLKMLQEFIGDVPLIVGEPAVAFRETVSTRGDTVLAKSANKHNRLYVFAEPLSRELVEAIESGRVSATQDVVTRTGILVDEFGWNRDDAKRIWCFGPDNEGANVFVDQTRGEKYVNDIRDSVAAAMQWVCAEGVLGEEPLRGVRFNLVDVKLHADSTHRGGGQIIQAARRVMHAACLSAAPQLVEPIFLVEIVCPSEAKHSVYSVLSNRRGYISKEEPRGPLVKLTGYMPVLESFGFSAALRSKTSGQAFPTLLFDHFETLPGSPLDGTSLAAQTLAEVRKRKQLPEAVQTLEKLSDRL